MQWAGWRPIGASEKALQSGENVARANEACNPAPGYAIRKDGDSISDENVVSDENSIPDEKNTAVDREKEHIRD